MVGKKSEWTGKGPLGLARTRELDPEFGSVIFETGRSVTFTYVRNTEKSPNFGSTYGQDIEPTGRYILHLELDPGSDGPPRGWDVGTETFKRPLVIELTLGGGSYGDKGWKARLVREADGKKGRALSAWLLKQGYDGIVVVESSGPTPGTREIVALRT